MRRRVGWGERHRKEEYLDLPIALSSPTNPPARYSLSTWSPITPSLHQVTIKVTRSHLSPDFLVSKDTKVQVTFWPHCHSQLPLGLPGPPKIGRSTLVFGSRFNFFPNVVLCWGSKSLFFASFFSDRASQQGLAKPTHLLSTGALSGH